MPDRFYRGMPATEAMGQLNGLNSDVQAVKDATAAGVASAAASAEQAAAARDGALQAWGASTAPAELLAAIARSAHKGSVVDVFLYDTSKDSDGGAWRKRCRHTSWESEPLTPGKWFGYQEGGDDDLYARGVRVGDYFQYVDGRFYEFGKGQDIHRGNTREFPALAVIVAEGSRIIIYDATRADLPMWMVFVHGVAWNEKLLIGGSTTSVTALNGKLYIGEGGNAQGLVIVDFVADQSRAHSSSVSYGGLDRLGIGSRNAPGHTFREGVGGVGIALLGANYVLDVAATVLPDAPIDPANGLPIATVAVGTTAGATVIKHDGTAFKWLPAEGHISSVDFGRNGALAATGGATVAYRSWFLDEVGSGTLHAASGLFSQTTVPSRWGTDGNTGVMRHIVRAGDRYAIASDIQTAPVPLILYKDNQVNYSCSMVAGIGTTFNTGWLVGDNRGAWLADTVAEAAVSTQLITNGTFDANVAGWIAAPSTALSAVNGAMRVQSLAAWDARCAVQDIATVIGKRYRLTFDVVGITHRAGLQIAPGGGYTGISEWTAGSLTVGSYSFEFTATAALYSIVLANYTATNGAYSDFDNVKVELVDADRSVKSQSLRIFGNITKAPVAPGAELVSYSGFAPGNYLEQPYSADLDFGTADFYFMGWVLRETDVDVVVICRTSPSFSGGFAQIILTPEGYTAFSVGPGIDALQSVFSTAPIKNGAWNFVCGVRSAGMIYTYVNGALSGEPTHANVSMSNPTAVSRFGVRQDGYYQPCKLALIRAGAGAPTADQIAQIYREELAMFQPGAKCALYGTDQAVGGIAYDDSTNLLHATTYSGYRSAFCGLVRAEGELTVNGTTGTRLSAAGGAIIAAGLLGATFKQPAVQLRDELRRRAEARRAMVREEIPLDFDGLAAQTQFPMPAGFVVRGAWVAGTKKRRGPTKDYTVTFDGYRETVVFGVSPGATWVQITATRSL